MQDVVGSLPQGAEKGAEEADERGDKRPARPRPPQPNNARPHARRVCVTKQCHQRPGCFAAVTTCELWRAAELGAVLSPPHPPFPFTRQKPRPPPPPLLPLHPPHPPAHRS